MSITSISLIFHGPGDITPGKIDFTAKGDILTLDVDVTQEIIYRKLQAELAVEGDLHSKLTELNKLVVETCNKQFEVDTVKTQLNVYIMKGSSPQGSPIASS